MKKLEFLDAPKANLETWDLVTKMLGYGAVSIAILLLIMAATLL